MKLKDLSEAKYLLDQCIIKFQKGEINDKAEFLYSRYKEDVQKIRELISIHKSLTI